MRDEHVVQLRMLLMYLERNFDEDGRSRDIIACRKTFVGAVRRASEEGAEF